MTEFLLVLLAAVGLAHILVDGSIMQPFKNKLMEWDGLRENGKLIRDEYGEIVLKPIEEQYWSWLRKLLSCYQCSGWWAGLIASSICMLSWLPYLFWLKIFLFAFAASIAAMIAAGLRIFLENSYQSDDYQTNGSSGDQASSSDGQNVSPPVP